jgi:hypothetical protein
MLLRGKTVVVVGGSSGIGLATAELARGGRAEDARRDMLAKTAAGLPVGRVGAGDDIGQQVLAFMTIVFATGSIVYVDGGAIIS